MCWEPTMKFARSTHHLLIGTLTPIAIFSTKFVSIILLPVAIARLLSVDRVYMWKFILILPEALLGRVTAKGIARGNDLPPGLSQRSEVFFVIIAIPIIEEIVFRSSFHRIWQSTVGPIDEKWYRRKQNWQRNAVIVVVKKEIERIYTSNS